MAYDEKKVLFCGPFPTKILSTQLYVNITYDQEVSVTPSRDIFEVRVTIVKNTCYSSLVIKDLFVGVRVSYLHFSFG